MKKHVILLLTLCIMIFILSGCGAKIDIDDSSYGFVEYVYYDKNEVEWSVLLDPDVVESNKKSLGKKELANWLSQNINYAIDQNGEMFSYKIITDEENKTLVCEPLGIRAIDKFFIMDDYLYVHTDEGDLYIAEDDEFQRILSNISELRLYNNDDHQFSAEIPRYYNASALTKDSELFVWGINSQGQLGNGKHSYNLAFYEYMDEFYERPYRVMDNVKDYKIDLTPENYYKSAAITNDGELYVWGALPRIKETVSINIGNEYIDRPIEKQHPDQKEYSPVKKLDNVKDFELKEDGVLAITKDGEEVLVNQNSNRGNKNQTENYINTARSSNLWEPVFDSVMQNLQGSFDNGEVDRIYGSIKNTMDFPWQNCRLLFLLYDENDNPIDQISIYIGYTQVGEIVEFSTRTNDSLFMYDATGFRLIEVSPNTM
ncbi:MAG: hypothetical protein ACOX5F_11450 [Anaerovoracaceae bacterium]